MNRSLALLMSLSFGVTALAACSSEPAPAAISNASTVPGSSDDLGEGPGDDADPSGAEEDAGPPKKGGTQEDAGADATGAAPGAGPSPFTKAEVQALFDSRCAPCHITNAASGMSLAGDFTTATVGVASMQVPTMKRIAPGDKDASYLFHKLRGTHLSVGGSGVRMPRNGPPYLDDGDIDRIGAFIDAL